MVLYRCLTWPEILALRFLVIQTKCETLSHTWVEVSWFKNKPATGAWIDRSLEQNAECRSELFNKWPRSGKLCSHLEKKIIWIHPSSHILNQFQMDQCLIAKDWKFKCPPIENWLNKLWHIPAINVMGIEKKKKSKELCINCYISWIYYVKKARYV